MREVAKILFDFVAGRPNLKTKVERASISHFFSLLV